MSFTSLLGIILVIAGIILPIFSKFSKPNHTFFAVAAIFNGFIIIFQGNNLDPIMQFCQIVMAVITISYTFESIQLNRKQP